MRGPSLTLRLFLIYALVTGLAGWIVWRHVLEQIKPAVRQSTEETLVDTSQLVAELIKDEVRAGRLDQSQLTAALATYGKREANAQIWGFQKQGVTHRVYVTDAQGRVIADSTGQDVGADYSRWNDVYLTLRGQYGARSTQAIPGDEGSSVMHVAAPIREGERIIGVVTVAKPNTSVQPFIDRARQRVIVLGIAVLAGGLLLGALASWWLSRVIRRLTGYADAVTAGQRVAVPQLPGHELHQLASALETMRTRLEGKDYVERYVQTLTHELKAPLAAISGAVEVLRGHPPEEQRQRFLGHVEQSSERLHRMSERLLELAQIEQRREPGPRETISAAALLAEVLRPFEPQLLKNQLRTQVEAEPSLQINGELPLLKQALANLLENAIEFSKPGGQLKLFAERDQAGIRIGVFNKGEAVPDYALPRLTERYYSLPRPTTGRRSSGLGLSYVQEVAKLHGAQLEVRNVEGGVEAALTGLLA